MLHIYDLFTPTDLLEELQAARAEYFRQQNQEPETNAIENRLRPCSADSRVLAFCRSYLSANRRLPSEQLVQRHCIRLGIPVRHQLTELTRARYIA